MLDGEWTKSNTINILMKHKMKLPTVKLLPLVIFVILAAALVITSLQMHWNARAFIEPAEVISQVQFIRNLAPRTDVALYVEIEAGRYENLFVRTVYSGLRLYANDILIYECGQEGTYPAWLLDPPPLNSIVPLPKDASSLRFDYTSPSQRSTMEVYMLMAGSEGSLLAELFAANGVLFIVSLFFLLIGLAVTVISLLYWRISKEMLHLGLLALIAGCGGLGECVLTAFFIPYPALLNIFGYFGLFTFTIPLLRFLLFILGPRNPLPIHIAVTVTIIGVGISFALQLFGIASFYRALPVFQTFAMAGVLTAAVMAIWEFFRNKNEIAKQFVPPMLMMIVMALLEIANFNLHFTHVNTLFLMSGALVAYIWLGFIGINRVFAIQRETEAIKEREQRLAMENAALDRLNRLKTDLMRTISHEMRTPLAVISGFAEITAENARKNSSDSQTAQNLDSIAIEAKRMADMMEEMRQLALAREYSKDRRSVDIGEVIYQIARLYEKVLERKGTILKLNIADNLPSVYANESELTQVLFNLLRNAETHTEDGTISITAETANGFVKTIICDTGTGIAKELLPRVFERGVHGEDGGTGYGLAICRDIITAYEGKIEIDSASGKGTTVAFTLPVI